MVAVTEFLVSTKPTAEQAEEVSAAVQQYVASFLKGISKRAAEESSSSTRTLFSKDFLAKGDLVLAKIKRLARVLSTIDTSLFKEKMAWLVPMAESICVMRDRLDNSVDAYIMAPRKSRRIMESDTQGLVLAIKQLDDLKVAIFLLIGIIYPESDDQEENSSSDLYGLNDFMAELDSVAQSFTVRR